ncbi:putative mitochondrial putative multi-pass transmembrane protein [Leptomonas pyrrhocoris]|uniref:Putative mitochondrial putative multi-pass transmembrane protein n=1 Tax=Leptomonas pyrrhocoris TaxID=157538 RepID=A0A0N0DV06_LEPPY|nr:putative mitochondrial putative multi-pass transmembrane protein [Leptomonas pyrrhocoris]XP_015657792.1 putative mitochondrial putative multi-pass transmembrane protein [Leptomonas pyrrhocoris]XP_015657793.1 putative mitochondrial putative multi-pass transmembrane protein [Leptomonas pyrrhocoris]XP_015657794.1 putative mitochondrial putative multi-pass transmembrane protein [Leptomonas pyrrhocoris]XP_015657795.1 putative mitochondrial putative multi-pass transmembrane protein [Leptomonas pyr|eukprot:XP_015657791.1 putative mitochondrial putative multi-pass transmembrane protein [Leptomonas pyrrhocoris]
MTEAEHKKRNFRLRLILYYIFALAYLAGALDFGIEYHNYWACVGFTLVLFFIALRMVLFVTPQWRLYQIFPPCSFARAAYQSFFLAACLAGVALGLWLMARGIQHHQSWTADSYFCGMTGMWMWAKWAYFVTVPIYDLREDTLEEESLIMLGLADPLKVMSENNEPVNEKCEV